MGGFLAKSSSNSYVFWGCIGLPRGVKWCKSEGVKDKVTPHSYIFFGRSTGVKQFRSSGVISPYPNSFIAPPPPWQTKKNVKVGGLICLLPPHSYTNLAPLAAKSYIILHPSILHCFSDYTWRLPVLNSQPLYPQLCRINLQTINACPTLDSLYLWIILSELPPLKKLPPHSDLIIPPQNKLPPHSYTIFPPWQPNSYTILPHLKKLPPHSYTILSPPHGSPTLTSFSPSEQISPSLLHLFTPFYMAISVRGVIPEKSDHCSRLQRTLTRQI